MQAVERKKGAKKAKSYAWTNEETQVFLGLMMSGSDRSPGVDIGFFEHIKKNKMPRTKAMEEQRFQSHRSQLRQQVEGAPPRLLLDQRL